MNIKSTLYVQQLWWWIWLWSCSNGQGEWWHLYHLWNVVPTSYSSTQKGPRKVSSFTAGFFPFWNSWDYYVFLQGVILNWCTNFEIFFLCPFWSFGFWHHPWEISNREAVSVQSVFTISMCNISLIVDRLPNMFSRKTRFFLRYLSTSSVSGFSNDV